MRKRVYAATRTASKSKKAKFPWRKSVAAKQTYKSPAGLVTFSTPSPTTVSGTRLRTTLIYAENGISLNPGVGGTAAVYVFSLNGLFDPNITGVGHQPAGFDQLMAIYEQYQVLGVSYRVCMFNSDTSLEAIHGVTANDQATTSADPRVYIENGMTQWKCSSRAAGSGPGVSQFSGYVDLAKLHGKTDRSYLDDDNYQGSASTNPSGQAYLHIWCAPMNGTSDIGDQVVYVELQYHCVMTGGKLNALS